MATALTLQDPVPLRDDPRYRRLQARLSDAGCFRPTPVRTALYAALVLAVYVAGYATLLTAPSPALRAVAWLALVFAGVHGGFIAHEVGHGATLRGRRAVIAIGQVFDTLLTGLAYAYFCHIHRHHHPHTNDRGRDPDMQDGAFSMYRESAQRKRGLARLITRYQAVLIWPLVTLQGFRLKYDGLQFVKREARATRLDQAVLLAHVALWFGPPVLILGLPDALLNYVAMTWLTGPYLGTIFLVNHIGTRVIHPDEPISFFAQQLATTRNLGASRTQDVLFGGLNNHIEHHAFPTMPTFRLRRARPITREFCRSHGLHYREGSWRAAVVDVARHFKAMAAFTPR